VRTIRERSRLSRSVSPLGSGAAIVTGKSTAPSESMARTTAATDRLLRKHLEKEVADRTWNVRHDGADVGRIVEEETGQHRERVIPVERCSAGETLEHHGAEREHVDP
jgi:hypothetical protein